MVPVFQMMREATAQIARQTDAVDFAPAIERVHPLPVTEVVPHNFLILLQQITRNIFQMLPNKRLSFSHISFLL